LQKLTETLGYIFYQLISWALIAMCVWMIHGFSAQDAKMSDALSLEVTDVVARVMKPEGAIKRSAESYQQLHGYVRKAAHALEYAVLALAGMMVLAPGRMRISFKVLLVLALCAAFASFDEWSQAGSLGRSPAVRDVLIDTGGALLGCIASLLARGMTLLSLKSRGYRRGSDRRERE
jgi:VanZ family protein